MKRTKEQEEGWWRKEGGREDKYIFVLCSCCGHWLVLMSAVREREVFTAAFESR